MWIGYDIACDSHLLAQAGILVVNFSLKKQKYGFFLYNFCLYNSKGFCWLKCGLQMICRKAGILIYISVLKTMWNLKHDNRAKLFLPLLCYETYPIFSGNILSCIYFIILKENSKFNIAHDKHFIKSKRCITIFLRQILSIS